MERGGDQFTSERLISHYEKSQSQKIIIRELPSRIRIVYDTPKPTTDHSLELLARGLTESVPEDLLALPFGQLAFQRNKITSALILHQIDRTRKTFREQFDSLKTLKSLEREELERITRNGPYRGFGYSTEFKNRLAALTREERERLDSYEATMQKLHRELWSILHELVSGFSPKDNFSSISYPLPVIQLAPTPSNSD